MSDREDDPRAVAGHGSDVLGHGDDVSADPESGQVAPARRGVGRRDLFTAAGAAVVGGAAGWGLAGLVDRDDESEPTPAASDSPSLPSADLVSGITHPAVPQRHMLVTVLDVDLEPDALLEAVRNASAGEHSDDSGVVTVTFGFSPEAARALWPDRATADMTVPSFAGDTAHIRSGGDLSVQVCAETAAAVSDATAVIVQALGQATVRWQAAGSRDAPTPEGTTRTSAGFIDGIANPRTAEELAEGVWTGDSRDTYVVYRRMSIDRAFLSLSHGDQEAAIGRRRDTGAPLSGGDTMDDIDLFAKSDDGRRLVPNEAHARRAHPANLGLALMLRRSYSYAAPTGPGVMFTAFMNDPQTFVATQRRLDEQDAFIAHTSTDAGGMFFVPAL
ncbi:Dyp-type peroxidase [Microbacterium halotolerans]|uniref:Dyp-type peroxidase n=1 Tax=Microbacterium halotolerans TaxID=246613 RepID=UPI000E6ADDFB|nr:Dyp-type peroxidase [Microbacterium halotolerans]